MPIVYINAIDGNLLSFHVVSFDGFNDIVLLGKDEMAIGWACIHDEAYVIL